MADKKRKRRRRRNKKNNPMLLKKIGKIAGVVVCVLVIAYLVVGVYFKNHFTPCTKVNGIDVSGKTAAQTEKLIQEELDGYTLEITDGSNNIEEIKATDISLKYVSDGSVQKLLDSQNSFLWIKTLLIGERKETEYSLEYDESSLEQIISGFACMNNEDEVEPESAYPEYRDGEFVIVEEVYGSKVDEEQFRKVIEQKLNTLDSSLVMEQEKCYVAPEYTSTSDAVVTACDQMNKYLQTQITYDMAGEELEITKDELAQMITYSSSMKAKISEKKVKAYVQKLKDTYDTVGTKRSFKSANGSKITVEGGNYGWSIDLEKETSRLSKDIKKGEAVKREPKYSQEASSHKEADWGDTYVEIDLTNQHVYYISGGKVKMECDVVTGNVSAGNATPPGVYYIVYKQTDRTLRGPKQPDGSYQWESDVAYWMPFNGGIGFHDATWRSSFGGNIYKTNGSHGCVNMPPAKAKELYGYVEAGTPVVVHY